MRNDSPQLFRRVVSFGTATICSVLVFSLPAFALASSSSTEIRSASYPSHTTWYNNRNASFTWNLPDSAIAVRTLYGRDPLSVPSRMYEPAISEKEFTADGEGVMFMHVQVKDENGWGPVAHYKFQIDTKPPQDLKAELLGGAETFYGNPGVHVSAYDALSGISAVRFVTDGGATTTYAVNAAGVYRLANLAPGNHTVRVYAEDRAGNTASTELSFHINSLSAPIVTEFKKYANDGDTLRVVGKTYPNVPVQVTYTNIRTSRSYDNMSFSGKEGTFVSLRINDLPSGTYEMRARVILSDGTKGTYSIPYALDLEHPLYIRVSTLLVNWLSIVFILILAAFGAVALLWYGAIRFKRWRRGVERAYRESQGALKMNVAALRRDSEEFYSLLAKTEKKRDLTKEEKTIMRKFKKRLDIVEKEMERKIEQMQ